VGEAEEGAPPHGLGVETTFFGKRRAGIDKHMNRREKAITAAYPGERPRGGGGGPVFFRPNRGPKGRNKFRVWIRN